MTTPFTLELPAKPSQLFTDLILDFTGTLSLDGKLLPGVSERLRRLANNLRITVLTADTFGQVQAELAHLPVTVRIVATGQDKADFVKKLDTAKVIVIGNGRNDVLMMRLAGLGIAVIGPEGAAGELLQVADVVVGDVVKALDLITNPLRVKATLRD